MLNADQLKAKEKFIDFLYDDSNNELVITGKAGTGKSYLVAELIIAAENNVKLHKLVDQDTQEAAIRLTATTNKAAKILSDKTNRETGTIHSLLGLKVYNNYQTGAVSLTKTAKTQVLHNTIIFIDEGSMINSELLKIIRECTINCKVIYIGDEFQLAPVKESHSPVFRDITNVVKLNTIVRQADQSPIALLGQEYCSAVQTNVFPNIIPVDGIIELLNVSDYQDAIDDAYRDSNYTSNTRAIAWTNKRVHQYNDYIREKLIGHPDFQIGEVVVTNKSIISNLSVTNEYVNLSTDSIHIITGIQEGSYAGLYTWVVELGGVLTVHLAKDRDKLSLLKKRAKSAKDWQEFFMLEEGFADLRPIYANTITKSQGSTYHTTFIDLPDIAKNGKWEEVARMLYVAVTRSTDRVVFLEGLPEKFMGN